MEPCMISHSLRPPSPEIRVLHRYMSLSKLGRKDVQKRWRQQSDGAKLRLAAGKDTYIKDWK
jgi:hypothetical protein